MNIRTVRLYMLFNEGIGGRSLLFRKYHGAGQEQHGEEDHHAEQLLALSGGGGSCLSFAFVLFHTV